jgi:hypothetical protein
MSSSSSSPRTASPLGPWLATLVTAAAAAGAAVFVSVEMAPGGIFGAGFDARASVVLGGMLMSLAAVMVSLILPVRAGRSVLAGGASAFVAFLAYALLNEIRF